MGPHGSWEPGSTAGAPGVRERTYQPARVRREWLVALVTHRGGSPRTRRVAHVVVRSEVAGATGETAHALSAAVCSGEPNGREWLPHGVHASPRRRSYAGRSR